MSIQVTEAINYLHEKDAFSVRVTHNDVNPRNIYLDKDAHVRLGNFAGATQALRTESRSKSTDVTSTFVEELWNTNFFLSERRYNNRQALPRKEDDVFSLGASLYATLLNECTLKKIFFKICEDEFEMKRPVWGKIMSMGDRRQECGMVYELLKIVEMCCLKKNSIESVQDAFEVLFLYISDLTINDKTVTENAADELKRILKLKEFNPDDAWVPISKLVND